MGPKRGEALPGNALRRISIADCVTLGNGVCGLLLVATMLGRLGGPHRAGLSHAQLVTSAALIAAGSIFDVADGPIACRYGSSGMGDALDSMCDALTFGVGPAVVLIAGTAGDPEPLHVLVIAVAGVFVVASMLRLARYSTFPAPRGGGFYGLTTPAAAGAVMALVFLRPSAPVLLSGVLAICALMVSEIRYPHQDRRTIPLLCVYWLAAAAGLAGLVPIWPVALAWLVAVPAVPFLASVASRSRRTRVSATMQATPAPVAPPTPTRLAGF